MKWRRCAGRTVTSSVSVVARSDNLIWLANQKRYKCRGCKKQFSVKVGTIFHDSPLGLDKWMVAMWMLANCRNGVSSYEIARTIGITQKSAWHMMHRIRKAMTDNEFHENGRQWRRLRWTRRS